MKNILIVGGYGKSGRLIVDMLISTSDVSITIAGRDTTRGAQFLEERADLAKRLSFLTLDARNTDQLKKVAKGFDLVVMACGTSATAIDSAKAIIEAGADYLDLQVSSIKTKTLHTLDDYAKRLGKCVITDAGFHPGLPAAMARHALAQHPDLTVTKISSLISINWHVDSPISQSTSEEFIEEFRDFSLEEFTNGQWRETKKMPRIDFSVPFGQRTCSIMGLAEMHELTCLFPQLKEAGFWIAGFNPFTDYLVFPIIWLGMKLFPHQLKSPLSSLLRWSMHKFSKPPYGVILKLEGDLNKPDTCELMRVSHPDAYVVTAAPIVSTILQMIDGSISRSGVFLQAIIVDTDRLFNDLLNFGIEVKYFW